MNEFLYGILSWINSWVGSWGVAMIVFTVMIRLVLTPLDVKSRVSMRKTSKLQPQIQALQKKYANDREKLNAKTAELYRKEHINPMASCLPLLLTWPILIAVFAAMRTVANEKLLEQFGQILQGNQPQLEPFLWIRNLWMPDNIFRPAYTDLDALRQIPADQWMTWFRDLQNAGLPPFMQDLGITATSFEPQYFEETLNRILTAVQNLPADQWQAWAADIQKTGVPAALQSLNLTAESFESASLAGTVQTISDALRTLTPAEWKDWVNSCLPEVIQGLRLDISSFDNGYAGQSLGYIIQTLRAEGSGAQFDFYRNALSDTPYSIMLLGTVPQLPNGFLILPVLSAVSQIVMTKIMSGNQAPQPAAEGQPNTGKFMQWFFPIFSLWICLGYSAAFALYWVAGNLVSMAQTLIINRVLDKKEKQAAVAGEGTIK